MGRRRGANAVKHTKHRRRLDKPVAPRGRNAVGTDIGRKRHAAAGVLAAMEATGHYWKAVCYELMRRSYEVVVINPTRR